MIKFPSKLSKEELIDKWDDYTSPARFAGNDDTMDLIFISKRNGDNVRLVRKARTVREPFTCVFRGKIKETEEGSVIEGSFTKAVFDYIFVGLMIAFMLYVRTIIASRGSSLGSVNALLAITVVGSLALLLNYRSTKRRYAEFIFRITGTELPLFRSKSDKT